MKVTHSDRGAWSEDIFEPDDPPTDNGKDNGHAKPASGDAWPVLDQAAYHGLAGDVVNTILPHTESDPVALLLQYLVSFGNVVGRQPYYFIEGAEHYSVLFGLLAGPTAKGRKGTAANRIRPIFDAADNDWAHNNVTSGISSGEGIIHAIHDDIYGTDKKTGMQVLVEAGVDDKRMLLDEREFSAALNSMQREGNVVSRIIRDAWDCPRVLRTLTKHNPTKVTRPHISILGQITIDELQRKLDQSAMMSGFANRFLYACVRRSQLLPHGGALHPDDEARLGAATLAAVSAARTFTRITMTSAADALWRAIYPSSRRMCPDCSAPPPPAAMLRPCGCRWSTRCSARRRRSMRSISVRRWRYGTTAKPLRATSSVTSAVIRSPTTSCARCAPPVPMG